MLSITRVNATTVSNEVRQGTPFSTEARLIWKPSRSNSLPLVIVFTTICTSPFCIRVSKSSSPPIFPTTSEGILFSANFRAVPCVAKD